MKEKDISFVNDYLAFLGLKAEKPSLDCLSKFMETHLYKVPFDGSNFTLHQPEKIILKNKAILKDFRVGKGGVCYQSNGAFCKLLTLLGFQATLVSVTMFRFGRDEPRPYAQMGQDVHCAVLVKLEDKEYLVDLVWGNAFRAPLEIGVEQIPLKGEDVRKCVKQGGLYQLKVKFDDKWEVEYQFKNQNKKTKEFASDVKFMCSPKHHLSSTLVLMQPLPNGEFKYVWKELYKENTGTIFSYFKSPEQLKTSSIEIGEAQQGEKELKKYGMSDENCEKILSVCGLKK